MTLMMMCALCPPMCRLMEDPDIRYAVRGLAPDTSPAPQELDRLLTLLHRRPDDMAAVLAVVPTLDREALALMHLCGSASRAKCWRCCAAAPLPPQRRDWRC